MKIKLLLILTLVFSNLIGTTQDFETLRFDKNLSFEFPTEYQQMDTLAQKVFFSNADPTVTIIATLLKANKNNHSSVESLKNGYDEFIEGMLIDLPNSKLVNSEFLKVDNLQSKKATITFTQNEIEMRLEAIVIFIKNNTYSFQAIYDGTRKINLKNSEIMKIIKSIKVNDLKIEDQLNDKN